MIVSNIPLGISFESLIEFFQVFSSNQIKLLKNQKSSIVKNKKK